LRGEAKVTLLKAYCVSLPHDTALFNTHCFYTSAFSTSCFVLSAIDGKIKQRIYIRFCMKLSKSTAKTLGMLCETLGEHSISRTVVFEWHSYFKAGQVSVEDDKVQGDQPPAKRQKMLKHSRTQPQRPSPNNP
jgi:hypothetical protein